MAIQEKPTSPPDDGIFRSSLRYVYWWEHHNDWHPTWNPTYRWGLETGLLERYTGDTNIASWTVDSFRSPLVQGWLFR